MVDDVKTRTKRSKRNRANAKKRNLVVTDDDRKIFALLDDHRLLRTSHLSALTGRSKGRLNKRIRILKDAGYLGWVNPKKEWKHKVNPEDIHALSEDGASLIGKERNKPVRDYSNLDDLNRDYKPLGVSHRMLISDFIVAVRVACANPENRCEYISRDEILASLSIEARKKKNPLRLKAPVRRDGVKVDTSTTPDEFFGIRLLDDPNPKTSRKYYFLEADCGTMVQGPRRNPDWSGVYKKYQTYYHYNRLKLFKDFGIPGFRVLYLTNKQDLRVKNAIGALKDIHKNPEGESVGWSQWLFGSKDMILGADEDVLSVDWYNGRWFESALTDGFSKLRS